MNKNAYNLNMNKNAYKTINLNILPENMFTINQCRKRF